jgi:hypothetical protein
MTAFEQVEGHGIAHGAESDESDLSHAETLLQSR